ncbi:MAG: sterol desaturase family protein [Saprospiraceae bacterium]|nr:sterol desaturase family protein [Saprospiraceae bacterium]
MDYIVLSIPIFFILIGVEVLIAKLKASGWYRFNDAISNISCGIASQITGVFSKTILIVGYIYLYDHFRLFQIPNNVWSWIILFIGVDFFYYWFHRFAHEISIFWGTHIVHHQSEEYNLSVALRQSSFQGFISMFFYLPLAILGFNPIAFVTVNAFQTLYQFWIHTKAINKMPSWFEFIFNTPSHHRVHHGRNPKYIDKNHGGTLIIFDRMFGTFQEEEEEVVYGVTKPLSSWNPVWANFDWYADMWQDLHKEMLWSDRIKLLFKKPGWLPAYLGGYRSPKELEKKEVHVYDTTIPLGLNYYILFQYLVILGITSLFLFNVKEFSRIEQIIISVFIILTIVSIGGIFEKRRWAYFLEILRFLLFIFGLYLIVPFQLILISLSISLSLISIVWIYQYKTLFHFKQQT